jgi:hypothetical protein
MTTPSVPTSYSPATWYDDAAGGTPIDSDALNRIENGIAGSYQYTGQFRFTPVQATGNYTASAGQLVEVTLSNANATVTLPTAYVGAYLAVKKMDATAYIANIATTNNQTIDGAAPGSAAVRLQNETRIYQGTATGWIVLAGLNTITALDAHYDSRYANRPLGTVAYAIRTTAGTSTSNTTGATAQPFIRLSAALTAGRMYRIHVKMQNNTPQTTAANQACVQLTYTTDGSAATVSSTQLQVFYSPALPTTGAYMPVNGRAFYVPSSNQTFTVLLSYFSTGAAVNAPAGAVIPATLEIEDMGVDVGATGTVNL